MFDVQDLTRSLKLKNDAKIVLVVSDGIGGLPIEPGGKTELETASTPNMDRLVEANICGLTIPVLPGITPGSGPGHLGLFGYDPLKHVIGRGALEAAGIDFEMGPKDVAIRANFCTVDDAGKITDRRAGRIASDASAKLVTRLRAVKIPGVEVFVEPVKEHRFVVVFRGEGLGDEVDDTDPQATGVPPLDPKARTAGSQKTAEVARQFINQGREILKNDKPANAFTMRGFARKPPLPSMQEVYGLKPVAIAVYPMYRGLARLCGMNVVPPPKDLAGEIDALRDNWGKYDFFFLHFKYTDSTGEDGNFEAKVKRIEELDTQIPRILELEPDVLIITGDHSTPAALKSHSWHPVPVLLVAKHCRPDRVRHFGENECLCGGLGQFEAKHLLTLALANAGKLNKFGA